ncbi:MAG: nuclear transport factor 2 family protein [Pseudomonadota bacterium]
MSDAAINQLFAAYADALNDFDADAIVDLFAYPATVWQFGKGHVFSDREDLMDNVEALLSAFDGAGVVTSACTIEMAEAPTGAGSAFASVLWTQDDAKGETVHEFRCGYLLVPDDGEWYIASVINPAEDDTDQ